MASQALRLASNVDGDFFVDSSCIDCAACRWIAPNTFTEDDTREYSRVSQQPETDDELQLARMALLACPTGSIGTGQKHDLSDAREAWPRQMTDNVYHCGYHHRSSYGAASYLIVRPEGNVLVDSPRFNRGLAEAIEALGGVKTMFLTHRDDVADHQKFADSFGCQRILHKHDVNRRTRDVEFKITGTDPLELADDLVVLPTPGHTHGSAVLLYDEKILFSGDHLFWNPHTKRLRASYNVCWYDWAAQTDSMERLSAYSFEWLLPGHGWPAHRPADEMHAQMATLLEEMRAI